MIYISASAIIKTDTFEVQSIYVVSEEVSYVLTKNANWTPIEVDMDIKVLEDIMHAQEFYFSRLVYSEIRAYNDDDAHSFSLFLQKQLGDSSKSEDFHKRLFKVLQMIGDKYSGGNK